MAVTKKKGLGIKGLGMEALINDQLSGLKDKERDKDGVLEIDINKIEPNRKQPRKYFDEVALEDLAASIKEYGIIQPVIVKTVEDYYEIIAGERRWRAAKIAGITKVPAIVRTMDEVSAFEIALVENIQRENLNPIEEAIGYKKLTEEYGYNQEQIAEKVGKSRSTVTNAMRLLNLDSRVQNFVMENKLSNGHARTLLSIQNGDRQFELAEKIMEEELSVREVEALVKQELYKEEEKAGDQENPAKSAKLFHTEAYKKVEEDLKNILGTKVKLNVGKNKGKIEIEYYSDEDLDRLLGMMKILER